MKQESIFEEYTKKSNIFGALKILAFHGFGDTPLALENNKD